MQEWLSANAGTIIVAIIGVICVNYQKSFELLTKQRLETFNSLKKCFADLRLLSSKPSLTKAIEANNSESHLLEIERVISQLKSLLPITRECEFELRRAADELYDKVRSYLFPQEDENSKLKDKELELQEQIRITFTFANIYLWTVWNYVQVLYKGRNRIKRKRIFKDELYKNYDRAKKLNDGLNKELKSAFFEKYAKEQLINH